VEAEVSSDAEEYPRTPMPLSPDEAEYGFLTVPGASLRIRLVPGPPELQVLGNRAGLLSLAELPFADVEPPASA
jgi:hypothetical protein